MASVGNQSVTSAEMVTALAYLQTMTLIEEETSRKKAVALESVTVTPREMSVTPNRQNTALKWENLITEVATYFHDG